MRELLYILLYHLLFLSLELNYELDTQNDFIKKKTFPLISVIFFLSKVGEGSLRPKPKVYVSLS